MGRDETRDWRDRLSRRVAPGRLDWPGGGLAVDHGESVVLPPAYRLSLLKGAHGFVMPPIFMLPLMLSLSAGPASLTVAPSATGVDLVFRGDTPLQERAVVEYSSWWRRDGGTVMRELERVTGASLRPQQIDVLICDCRSWSGSAGTAMHLRGYDVAATRQATLTHELVHRYLEQMAIDPGCYDDVHQVVSLVLYEAWSELWGRGFVERHAAIESEWSDRYRSAWADVLAWSQSRRSAERQRLLHACRAASRRANEGTDASRPHDHMAADASGWLMAPNPEGSYLTVSRPTRRSRKM